jgi:hypothetical protein
MVFLRVPISFRVSLPPNQLPPVWREECPLLNPTHILTASLGKLHSSVPMIKVRFSKATRHCVTEDSNIGSHSNEKLKSHLV